MTNAKMATVFGGDPSLNGINLLWAAQQAQFPRDRALTRKEIMARTGVSATIVSRWVRGLVMVPEKYCAMIGLPLEERARFLDVTLEGERERMRPAATAHRQPPRMHLRHHRLRNLPTKRSMVPARSLYHLPHLTLRHTHQPAHLPASTPRMPRNAPANHLTPTERRNRTAPRNALPRHRQFPLTRPRRILPRRTHRAILHGSLRPSARPHIQTRRVERITGSAGVPARIHPPKRKRPKFALSGVYPCAETFLYPAKIPCADVQIHREKSHAKNTHRHPSRAFYASNAHGHRPQKTKK